MSPWIVYNTGMHYMQQLTKQAIKHVSMLSFMHNQTQVSIWSVLTPVLGLLKQLWYSPCSQPSVINITALNNGQVK